MIVVPGCRGHRIEIAASSVDGGRFNTVVHIRRTLSEAKPVVEMVTCLKVNAALAKQASERWATRHIDLLHEACT